MGSSTAAAEGPKEEATSVTGNCQFDFPLAKITESRAPADIKQEGSSLDLSVTIGILRASNSIKSNECFCRASFEEKEDYAG